MLRRFTGRWVAIVGVALLVLACGVGVRIAAAPRIQRRLASEQAALLRDDRTEVQRSAARRLVELGEPGVQPLVVALGDERDDVFIIAAEGIDELLARCKLLPHAEASQRLAALAQALAASAAELPSERQYVARQWAERILVWPLEPEAVDVARLLADCETILRQDRFHGEVASRVRKPNRPLDIPTAIVSSAAPAPELVAVQEPQPIEVAEAAVPPLEPLPLLAAPAEPAPQIVHSTRPEPQRFLAPQARMLPSHGRPITAVDPTVTPESTDRFAFLRLEAELDVMRRLHASDKELAAAAENELWRRGYRSTDLPLCRALVDPDPEQRRQLAEALPKMLAVDSRPWLLQLTEDPDADVRRAATGILRTSRDPGLLRRLE